MSEIEHILIIMRTRAQTSSPTLTDALIEVAQVMNSGAGLISILGTTKDAAVRLVDAEAGFDISSQHSVRPDVQPRRDDRSRQHAGHRYDFHNLSAGIMKE